jgi:hypothetical protein
MRPEHQHDGRSNLAVRHVHSDGWKHGSVCQLEQGDRTGEDDKIAVPVQIKHAIDLGH